MRPPYARAIARQGAAHLREALPGEVAVPLQGPRGTIEPMAQHTDSHEPAEVRLAGGNVGGAVRVGDTVRRPTGPWTPAVHAFLRHLEDAGLDGVPRVLGIDGEGREILTYLPGRAVDVSAQMVSDELLASGVRWLRCFHDLVRQYRPAGPVQWRGIRKVLADDEIICHHDSGAYNWIVSGNRCSTADDIDVACHAPTLQPFTKSGQRVFDLGLAEQWARHARVRSCSAMKTPRRRNAAGALTNASVLPYAVSSGNHHVCSDRPSVQAGASTSS